MILEITRKFPWIRRPKAVPVASDGSIPAHKSWVKTAEGLGWLVRHDVEGFTVELQDGRRIITKVFERADAP